MIAAIGKPCLRQAKVVRPEEHPMNGDDFATDLRESDLRHAAVRGPRLVPVERSYQRVSQQIIDLIAEGSYKRGKRLPSERALAARLNGIPPAVRTANIWRQ